MELDRSLLSRNLRLSDLPDEVKTLYDAARPSLLSGDYGSGFFVGCSAKANGSILRGFNSELHGYNDAVHAEEAMISHLRAGSRGPLSPLEAVLVTSNSRSPISPCGACRDWLASYAPDRDMPVFLSNCEGDVIPATMRLLLPGVDDLLRCGRASEVPDEDPLTRFARDQALKAGVG